MSDPTEHAQAVAAVGSAASGAYKTLTVGGVGGGAVAAVEGVSHGNLWLGLGGLAVAVLTLLLNAWRTRRELEYRAASDAREAEMAAMREAEHLARMEVLRQRKDTGPTEPGAL